VRWSRILESSSRGCRRAIRGFGVSAYAKESDVIRAAATAYFRKSAAVKGFGVGDGGVGGVVLGAVAAEVFAAAVLL